MVGLQQQRRLGGESGPSADPRSPGPRAIAGRAAAVVLVGVSGAWAVFAVWHGLSPTKAARDAIDGTLHQLPQIFGAVPRNVGSAALFLVLLGSMAIPGRLLVRWLGVRPEGASESWVLAWGAGLAGWVPVVLFFGWSIGLRRLDVLVPTCAYVVLPLTARPWRPSRAPGGAGEDPVGAGEDPVGAGEGPGAGTGAEVPPAARTGGSRAGRLVDVVLCAAIAVVCWFSLLGALEPEVNWDATWYHLGPAPHLIASGGFTNIVAATHDPALGLNPYQEISLTGLYALGGVHGAKMLPFVNLLLCLAAIVVFCRVHLGSHRIGLVAALAFVSLPIVSWAGTTTYNDLPMGLFTLLSVHCLLRWRWRREAEAWRWALLGVGFAAFTFGVKAFGAFTLALALGYVAAGLLIRRSSRSPAAIRLVSAGAAVVAVCLPWWLRVGAMTGNPVFPVANQFFHSQYWNQYAARAQSASNRKVGLFRLPWDLPAYLWRTVTHPAPFHTLVGPLFLVGIPLCAFLLLVARPVDRLVLLLWGYVVAWAAAWYLSAQPDSRYLLGITPLACIAVFATFRGAARTGAVRRVVPVAAGAVTLACAALTTPLTTPWLVQAASPEVLGQIPYNWSYLYQGLPEYDDVQRFLPMIDYANRHLPSSAKIFDDAEISQDYLFLVPQYFNGIGYGSPAVMRQWSLTSPNALAELRRNHITDLLFTPSTWSGVEHTPLAAHLAFVHASTDDLLLYRLKD